MKRRHLVALGAAALLPALFGPAGAARAAYLDPAGGEPGEREPAPPLRRPPVVEPDFRIRNPVTHLIRRIDVGAPYYYRDLTVFPLLLDSGWGQSRVRTLDEALSRGWILIREKDEASVPYVTVRNDSAHHVLLMAGEIIVGGRQNRIIRDDVLLPPNSRFIEVAVYCGEQARWTGEKPAFESRVSLAHPQLRKGLAAGESQDRIWGEIEASSERAAVRSPTRDYQRIYEDDAIRRQLDDCVGGFRRHVRGNVVGAVAVAGGSILGADMFSDPQLFSALWEKILRSYGVGYLRAAPGWRGGVSAQDVRRFLDRSLSASYRERHTPGAGELLEIRGGSDGAALVWQGDAVHASLFGERVYYERPEPPPPPRPRPLPRPEPMPEPRPWLRER